MVKDFHVILIATLIEKSSINFENELGLKINFTARRRHSDWLAEQIRICLEIEDQLLLLILSVPSQPTMPVIS